MRLRSLLLGGLAASLAACADSPVAPATAGIARVGTADVVTTSTSYSGGALWQDATLWYRRTWVCKVGTAATFQISVNGGPVSEVSIADDECLQVHYSTVDELGADTVRVTEVAVPGIRLDSIVRDSTHGENIFRLSTIIGEMASRGIETRSKGAILTFFNSVTPPPPPPGGGEGCTPGYWKQSQHFAAWTAPYTPSTLFSDVFADAFPGMTLLDVAAQGGGGLNALGRHTVAALLNSASASVDYDLSTADVIAKFNAAFASGNYETQKNEFEGFNEQGCEIKLAKDSAKAKKGKGK